MNIYVTSVYKTEDDWQVRTLRSTFAFSLFPSIICDLIMDHLVFRVFEHNDTWPEIPTGLVLIHAHDQVGYPRGCNPLDASPSWSLSCVITGAPDGAISYGQGATQGLAWLGLCGRPLLARDAGTILRRSNLQTWIYFSILWGPRPSGLFFQETPLVLLFQTLGPARLWWVSSWAAFLGRSTLCCQDPRSGENPT